MKTITYTLGQTLLLLAIGVVVGLSANAVRGRDHIDINRDHFRWDPIPVDPNGTEVDLFNLPAAIPGHPFREVTLQQVSELFQDPKAGYGVYVFVDARSDEPYQAGHIPGAVQCDFYRIGSYLDTVLGKVFGAEKVIVYCNGGECEDSLSVCGELLNNAVPWPNIYLFKGGWEAWHQSGMPFKAGAEE